MDLSSIITTIKEDRLELYDYILGGNYDNEDLCYEFISLVKWHDLVECRNPKCLHIADELNFNCIITPEIIASGKYKKATPYSYRCPNCSTVELTTAHTRLHGFGYLPALFEFVHLIVLQTGTGRLSDNEIYAIMAKDNEPSLNNTRLNEKMAELISELAGLSKVIDGLQLNSKIDETYNSDLYAKFVAKYITNQNFEPESELRIFKERRAIYQNALDLIKDDRYSQKGSNKISLSTVEEYRFMVQQYFGDWSFGKAASNNPYGIEIFWFKKGDVILPVVIARQMSPNGHVRASILKNDSAQEINRFLDENLPSGCHIILYNFDEKYKGEINLHFAIEYNTNYRDFDIYPFHVAYATIIIKRWFLNRTALNKIDLDLNRLTNVLVHARKAKFGVYDYELKKMCEAYPSEIQTTLNLSDIERMQLHLNEAVFINFYEGLDTAILLMLLILFPSKELRPRNKKANVMKRQERNISTSPVVKPAKIRRE